MECKRVFILGAGFSKAAGLPLATELTEILTREAESLYSLPNENADQVEWLRDFHERMVAMQGTVTAIYVEQFFDFAYHDAEMWRMRQQRCRVGRNYGQTPWNKAEIIDGLLQNLRDQMINVIRDRQREATRDEISALCKYLCTGDAVLTFNYDTLVETALDDCDISWSHGLNDLKGEPHVVVLKLHGSVDWFQFERNNALPGFTKLYSKADENADEDNAPDEFEYQAELWRAENPNALDNAFEQYQGLSDRWVWPGVAALGGFKRLHELIGSGLTWDRARGALRDAQQIVIVGFSLSPYDAMARLLFSDAMRDRKQEGNPPQEIRLIDPNADRLAANYRDVFQFPMVFDTRMCQDVDWHKLLV